MQGFGEASLALGVFFLCQKDNGILLVHWKKYAKLVLGDLVYKIAKESPYHRRVEGQYGRSNLQMKVRKLEFSFVVKTQDGQCI
jgi:hypothetical protein